MRPDFARGRKRRSRSLPAMTALLAVVLGVAPVAGGVVEIGAPFTLTDQNGKTRADTDFRGSYMLVYFGYTFCPDICPVGLMKMTEALAALELSLIHI